MFEQTQMKIQQMIDQQILPGAVYAFIDVTQQKNEIHWKGLKSRLPNEELMLPDTVFDLASLTKVIGTTTVIFQLIAEGKLGFTDKVKDYLDIQSTDLLVMDLLLHQSDFTGYIPNRDQLSEGELTKALLNEMQPGEKIHQQVKYSDINFVYLGWIIEAITGQSVQSAIEERVIIPMNLNQTTFQPNRLNSAPTENHAKRGLLRGVVHDPKAYQLGAHCGSAGLFSTIDDLIKFSYMYLRHGQSIEGKAIISADIIDQLSEPQTLESQGQLRTFGWQLEKVGDHFALTHTGYTGTYLWIDLTLKRAFIFLSNRIHPVDNKEEYLKARDEMIACFISEQ